MPPPARISTARSAASLASAAPSDAPRRANSIVPFDPAANASGIFVSLSRFFKQDAYLSGGTSGRRSGTGRLFRVASLQIVDEQIDLKPHDIPLDYIVTPEEIIACHTKLHRPRGIYWKFLDEEKIAAIPVLQDLQAGAPRS